MRRQQLRASEPVVDIPDVHSTVGGKWHTAGRTAVVDSVGLGFLPSNSHESTQGCFGKDM